MLSHFDFTANMLLAILLGSVIGIERQWRQRFAGLRTNSLVSTGSCLFVLLSQMIPTNGDQSRIASYVVSGVGFLGAGVIMKDGGSVRGLNTAATLWCSAAVGALAGFGLHFEASMATLAVVAMHLTLRPLAQLVNRQPVEVADREMRYHLKIVCKEDCEIRVRSIILQTVSGSELVLRSLESIDAGTGTQKVDVSADLDCRSSQNHQLESLISRISLERGVSAAKWSMRSVIEEAV